nr:MAG TPA: hypothetical protein [Caudoviricetes sp.]
MEEAFCCAVAFFPSCAVTRFSSEEYSFCCWMMFCICLRYSLSPSTLIRGPMSVLAKRYHLLIVSPPAYRDRHRLSGLHRSRSAYTPYNPAFGQAGRPELRALSCQAFGRNTDTMWYSAGSHGGFAVFWVVIRCDLHIAGGPAAQSHGNVGPDLDDLRAGQNRLKNIIFRKVCGIFRLFAGKRSACGEIRLASFRQRAQRGQDHTHHFGQFLLVGVSSDALHDRVDIAERFFQHIRRPDGQAERKFLALDIRPHNILVVHLLFASQSFFDKGHCLAFGREQGLRDDLPAVLRAVVPQDGEVDVLSLPVNLILLRGGVVTGHLAAAFCQNNGAPVALAVPLALFRGTDADVGRLHLRTILQSLNAVAAVHLHRVARFQAHEEGFVVRGQAVNGHGAGAVREGGAGLGLGQPVVGVEVVIVAGRDIGAHTHRAAQLADAGVSDVPTVGCIQRDMDVGKTGRHNAFRILRHVFSSK